MIFFFISFVAGILTVLAPCVLPLLPVIVGGAAVDAHSKWKPYIITASLAVSVVAFTLLLKVTTLFIDIPQVFWQYFSGTILIFFGLITLFPDLWERGAIKFNLFVSRKANRALAQGAQKNAFWGDVIMGAALGPVFSSCSPTYFVILATVLPQSFAMGFIDLVAYAVGLSLSLLLVAIIGQKLVGKLSGASDSHGWFKRSLGALFLIVGIFVFTGWSAQIEAYLITKFDVAKVENGILQGFDSPLEGSTATAGRGVNFPKYIEIENPSGFVNSKPFKLADLVGKKVILLDFMTYSCINCQRTFPYLKAWYEKYKSEGLEIAAIHTPEFAFEHKIENVEAAFAQYGLTFPAVLDNDYGTWNAYQNQYWPHKYLIDIDGNIRYDHIGEGGYDETESQIKSLLAERAQKLGEKVSTDGNVSDMIVSTKIDTQSTETYFGAFRNSEFFGNGTGGKIYEADFDLPRTFPNNQFFLGGKWSVQDQYIESEADNIVAFSYNAAKVYLVAEAPNGAKVDVLNGDFANDPANTISVNVKNATLYTIVSNPSRKSSVLYISVPKGVRLYSLTFG
ncbi:MAG: cytochrome c biogenesis protein CcdA [Patescibacteria group bacterium]